MGLRERISEAQTSDNLGESISGLGDVDVIRACGMVSKQQPLGMSLWRLKYSDLWEEARNALDGLTMMLVKRRKLPASVARSAAERVLAHWVGDRCDACHGQGYELMRGAPTLSDTPCPVCKGDGKLKLADADQHEVWLQQQIAIMESDTAGAIMQKLREDF